MSDPRPDRYAQLIVQRMLGLKRGDQLLITVDPAGEELAARVAAAATRAGAVASVWMASDRAERARLIAGSADDLDQSNELRLALMERADALLRIDATDEPEALADVPADLLAAATRARGAAQQAVRRRALAGALRWAVAAWPCDAFAAAAGMTPEAFAELVWRGAKVDQADPVAAWGHQELQHERLLEVLRPGSELRIRGDGTDLTLRIDGRAWRSSAANRNIPDGEVFTGPLETSANGSFHAAFPVTRGGRRISGIRLRFEAGVVVAASAEEGEDALHALLEVDPGARRLGEVGIGTNYGLDRFVGRILMDEKIGGSVHVALGNGYPETGSTNVSAEHWDLICDLRAGGELTLDGRTLQADGRFAADLGVEL